MEAQVRVEFTASSGGEAARGYRIEIGAAMYSKLPAWLTSHCPAHRYSVITDSNVAPLYGQTVLEAVRTLAPSSDLFVFPAGEANKNRESWALLSDEMLAAGHGRDSAVVALGGGVTGDLAGFVAASYLRGLPLIQLPTSLLAMIDSSVGGKTGVDTPAGKNLIGAFHQPRLVVADVETLRTLPLEHVRSGLAEALKHGMIADADYFRESVAAADALLGLEHDALVRLITRSVEIKAGVVGADEREGGLRKILNFGHTIGHAVEALSDFELLHGEAISIGMIVEARIGEKLGVTTAGATEEIRNAIERFGLPTEVPAGFGANAILDLTRVDKKAREGQVEYSLLTEIGSSSRGSGSYGVRVEDAVVVEALEELRASQ